ncbi:MAG: DUF1549 domain-containing protein [Phycisphaeraceae bacterium]
MAHRAVKTREDPSRALRLSVTFLLPLAFAATSARAEEDQISFRHDVMPVLIKSGCMAGACHGNLNGKGGFKLSLRGEDAAFDLGKLTREQLGRRINLFDPVASLILRKATATVPHEGGRRFAADSAEYRTLLRWIAQGAPDDDKNLPALVKLSVEPREVVLTEPTSSVQLKVEATFANGTKRDVTSLAVYELSNLSATVSPAGLVERVKAGQTTAIVRFLHLQEPARIAFVPARPNFTWADPPANNYIDMAVFAKLRTLRMNPSPLCSDTEFVRRVYLDLLGLIPTADEARAFVEDAASDKRAKLVDALLERPEFADFWALKWNDLLRNEERVLDSKGVRAFYWWIRESVASNKPVDEFVRDLLTTTGSTYSEPASNFYRAIRAVDVRAETTAQIFLGTRMQCAKCHNHPFDRWTQDDYHGFAAYFASLNYKIIRNDVRDKSDKGMFIGEQIVTVDKGKQWKHPGDGRVMTPALLPLASPPPNSDPNPSNQLHSLAAWLTDPRNPRFAAAQVNRIWYHLMGKGVVDPIDDFRDTNPPGNPELMAALTEDFVASKYDMKQMIRTICSSRVYQLSAEPVSDNLEDESSFARAYLRRLTAEQLLDSMARAMETPLQYDGLPLGIRAAQIPGVNTVYRDRDPSDGDRFLKLFGRPPRLIACECERSNDTALGQVFELTSGRLIDRLITSQDGRVSRLLNTNQDDAASIEELYWAVLSRAPSLRESTAAMKLIADTRDRRAALEDLTWGLLNAKEFLLRR